MARGCTFTVTLATILACLSFLCNLACGTRTQPLPRSPSSFSKAISDVVVTQNGPVRGVRTNGTIAFLGIPYAKAPVGDLRFASPFPPESWTEVLNTTQFSPGCPQHCELPEIMCPPVQSEDCLYLNVYVPDKVPPPGGFDVYAFIHGGAFQNGAAGTLAYAGFGFAMHDIITVTMNYRLGALGFLTYGDIEGNYGFQDQIMSLKWIRDNINSFGGDKTKVTLGGESAGAVSVMCHMVAPLSQGLFSKVIIESSPIALPFSRPKDNRFYEKFVSLSGCEDSKKSAADCLRDISADDMVNLMDKTQKDIFPFPNPDIIFMPWTPTIGTVDLPIHPYVGLVNKQMSKVPVLVGGNLEDARIFLYGFANFTLDPLEYYAAVVALFGEDAKEIIDLYPASSDPKHTMERVITDYIFQCLGRFVAETYSSVGEPAFLYDFGYPTRMFWGKWGNICLDHPCHGGELMFVFNNINSIKNATEEEKTLASKMNAYWSNFIVHSNPSPSANNQTAWPEYNGQDQMWMNFSSPDPATIPHFKEAKCDFWDKIGYYREPGII